MYKMNWNSYKIISEGVTFTLKSDHKNLGLRLSWGVIITLRDELALISLYDAADLGQHSTSSVISYHYYFFSLSYYLYVKCINCLQNTHIETTRPLLDKGINYTRTLIFFHILFLNLWQQTNIDHKLEQE